MRAHVNEDHVASVGGLKELGPAHADGRAESGVERSQRPRSPRKRISSRSSRC